MATETKRVVKRRLTPRQQRQAIERLHEVTIKTYGSGHPPTIDGVEVVHLEIVVKTVLHGQPRIYINGARVLHPTTLVDTTNKRLASDEGLLRSPT